MFLIATAALAADPVAGVHAASLLGPDAATAGAGGSYGVNIGAVDFELAGDLGVGTEAAGFVRPQLRWLPRPALEPGPSVVGGLGVLFVPDGEDAAVELGLGYDLGRSPWRPRVQLAYVGLPGRGQRALLTIGLVHRKRPPTGVVPRAAVDFDAAMVWVPGPVCQWLPTEEAELAFLRTSADPAAVATLGGSEGSGDDTVASGPRGDLVVAAWPGDVVTVDDRPLDVAPDGIAWANLPEGPASVRVVGGGRREVLDVAVSADATLWVSPGAVEPVELRFEVGSSELEGPSAATLDALADTLGGWHLRIWGSFSVEGDPVANEALALARAESARDRLLLAGIPAEQLHLLPPHSPAATLTAEEQRVAVLEPVAPGEAR